MRNALLIAALSTVVACGYSEDSYLEDYDEVRCEWTVACYPSLYADVDECLQDFLGADQQVSEECEYDPQEARECVRGWENLDCPEGEEFPATPAACSDVYDCPAQDTDTGS